MSSSFLEMNSSFTRFDSVSMGLNDLVFVKQHLDNVSFDSNQWKWVVIGLHSSIQNFMVSALWQGNGFFVMSDKSYKEWFDKDERNEVLSQDKIKMDGFMNLYKKTKNKEMMSCYVFSKPFLAKKNHDASMRSLNKIRNQLIHFNYGSLDLNLNGMLNLISDCLFFMKFLALDSGTFSYKNENELEKIKTVLDELSQVIGEMKNVGSVA